MKFKLRTKDTHDKFMKHHDISLYVMNEMFDMLYFEITKYNYNNQQDKEVEQK